MYNIWGLEAATTLARIADAVPTTAIPLNLHPNATDEDAVTKAIRSIYLKEGETFAGNLVQFARVSVWYLYKNIMLKHFFSTLLIMVLTEE